MAGGNAIKGSRIGSGPDGDMVRGDLAPRVQVPYWCSEGHETRLTFAADPKVEIPDQWTCVRCGEPAGQDETNPPISTPHVPFKSHLDYVRERRTDAEGEELLDEVLTGLRDRRSTRLKK